MHNVSQRTGIVYLIAGLLLVLWGGESRAEVICPDPSQRFVVDEIAHSLGPGWYGGPNPPQVGASYYDSSEVFQSPLQGTEPAEQCVTNSPLIATPTVAVVRDVNGNASRVQGTYSGSYVRTVGGPQPCNNFSTTINVTARWNAYGSCQIVATPTPSPTPDPEPECEAGHYERRFFAEGHVPSGEYCQDGCSVTLSGPYINIPCTSSGGCPAGSQVIGAGTTQTGQSCGAPEIESEPGEDEALGDGTVGQCADGVCINDDKPHCGYVNGEYACFGTGLEQGCVETQSGGMFCIASAPNKPDNGTPGQDADPDQQFGLDDGDDSNGKPDIVNYYGGGTVNNSNNYGGNGEGDGEGGGDCNPLTEDCGEGAAFKGPKIRYEYSSPREAIINRQERIADLFEQIRAESQLMLSGMPTGGSAALPCWPFEVFGEDIEIGLCGFEDELNIIGLIVLLASLLISAYIVLGTRRD